MTVFDFRTQTPDPGPADPAIPRDVDTDLDVRVFDFRLENGGTTNFPDGVIYPLGESLVTYARAGDVAPLSGKLRYRFPFAGMILGVSAAIGTPPDGQPIIFDVLKNGIVITTVTFPVAASDVGEAALRVPIVAGDYVTVNVSQAGTTTQGADLSIFIRYERQ